MQRWVQQLVFNKINKTAQKLLQFQVFFFKTNFFFSDADIETVTKIQHVLQGNGELLELRLLETGFLSRFQLNP
jgi:AAA15 family ATPase/GTPase